MLALILLIVLKMLDQASFVPAEAHRLATIEQSIELLKAAISALSKHQRAQAPFRPAGSRILERFPILVQVDSHLTHLVIAEIELGRRDTILKQSTVLLIPQIHIVLDVLLAHVVLKHALLLDGFDLVRVERRFENWRTILVHRVCGIKRGQVGNLIAVAATIRRV